MPRIVRTEDQQVTVSNTPSPTGALKAIPTSPPPAPTPTPKPVSVRPSAPSTDEILAEGIMNMPEREYNDTMKRLLRAREMEMMGITKSKQQAVSVGQVSAPKDRPGTEVVKLANSLKEEYQALNEAGAIFKQFTKPNPVESVMNSEFGKGLGQVVGQFMMGAVDTYTRKQVEKKMAQMQGGGPRPGMPPMAPPQQYSPDNPPPMPPSPEEFQQAQQSMPPPMPQQQPPLPYPQPGQFVPAQQRIQYPANMPLARNAPPPPVSVDVPMQQAMPPMAPPEVRVKERIQLDANDRKILENLSGQQDGMLKITEALSSLVSKIENISGRLDSIEKAKAMPTAPTPTSTTPSPPVPSETEKEIEGLFKGDGESEEEKK